MGQPVVLLVHYDPRQVRSLQGALEANGFTVHTRTDGEAALRSFPEIQPDVVVVEAMIPRRNGFEVCKELKSTDAGRRTPIVITSGVFRSVKHRTEAVHTYGCQEFLGRGFSPADLVKAVRSLLPGAFVGGPPPAAQAPAPSPAVHAETPPSHEPHTEASRGERHAESPLNAPPPEASLRERHVEPSPFSDILAELSEESVFGAPAEEGESAFLVPERDPVLAAAAIPEGADPLLAEDEVSSWLDTLFPSADSGGLADQLRSHAVTRDAFDGLHAGATPDDRDVSVELVEGMESAEAGGWTEEPRGPLRIEETSPSERFAAGVETPAPEPEEAEPPALHAPDEPAEQSGAIGAAGREPTREEFLAEMIPPELYEDPAEAAPSEAAPVAEEEGVAPSGWLSALPASAALDPEPDLPAPEAVVEDAPLGPPETPRPLELDTTLLHRTDATGRASARTASPSLKGARKAQGREAASQTAEAEPEAEPEPEPDAALSQEADEGPSSLMAESSSEFYGDAPSPLAEMLESGPEADEAEASFPLAGAILPDLDPRAVPEIAPQDAPRPPAIGLALETPPRPARARSRVQPLQVEEVPLPAPAKRTRRLPLSLVTLGVAGACGGWYFVQNSLIPSLQTAAPIVSSRRSAHRTHVKNPSVGGSLAYLGGEAPGPEGSAPDASGSPGETAAQDQEPAPARQATPESDPARETSPASRPAAPAQHDPPVETPSSRQRDGESSSPNAPASSSARRTSARAASPPATRPASAGTQPAAGRPPSKLTIVESDGRTVLPPKAAHPAAPADAVEKPAPQPSGRSDGQAIRNAPKNTSSNAPANPSAPRVRKPEPSTALQPAPWFGVMVGGLPTIGSEEHAGAKSPAAPERAPRPDSAGAEPRADAAGREAGDPGSAASGRATSDRSSATEAKPVPLSRRPPSYPAAAKSLRIHGEVLMQVLVEENGSVGDVRVIRTPSPILATAATAAVRGWRYRPAMRGGRAVSAWITESITFMED